MTVRFTYRIVASALHDVAAVAELTAPIRSVLDSLGGAEETSAANTAAAGRESRHGAPRLLVVATGGTERALLDDIGESAAPVVLVAHGAHNSLPAALETLAAIRARGGRGRIVFAGGAESDAAELGEAIGDLETVARLASTRLGVVGGPSSWLVASSPSADAVRRTWGPMLVTVDPGRMIELTRAPVVPTGRLAERFTSVADPVRSTVGRRAVDEAMGVQAALTDVLETHSLDAVTVRCFDLLGDPGTSGCLALASLNDDGVVAGCEGDVPSTLAMLLVRYLLGQPAWMANPAQVEPGPNRLVLAHCTVAPSMVEDLALDTHFESGRGVGISGHFAEQPVTLLRLGGPELDRCWIAEGRIVATGDDPDLCRTQVTVELSTGHVDELLEHPLGNHLVLAVGHHERRLRRWWQLAIAD